MFYTPYSIQSQGQFLFSIVWSIGATCDQDGRTKFDAFLKELTLGKIDAHPTPKSIGKMDLPFPNENTVYDYMYDVSIVPSLSSKCFLGN